jgi:hypothetical protein
MDRWDRGLHDFVREAIGLRSAESVLRHGRLAVLAAEGDTVVYERRLDDRAMLVAVNAGSADASVRVRPSQGATSKADERFAVGGAGWTVDRDGSIDLALEGRAGRVLELARG